MATQWHFNPFTGTLDKVIDPTEAIAHTDLSDMPDSGGTNTDHDLRYWTLATDQTLLTGDKSGSFDLTTTGNVTSYNSGTITRTDGLVTEMTIGSRTITVNRDGDDIVTGWEDADYETTLTRSDGVITEWETVAK